MESIHLNGGYLSKRKEGVGFTLFGDDGPAVAIIPTDDEELARDSAIGILYSIRQAFNAGEAAGASAERRAITYGFKAVFQALQAE